MIYIVLGVITVIIVFILITYNILVRENNKVKEAFSLMDVYLKKRWDLVPNLLDVVKAYTFHEKETLTQIVKRRNSNYNDLSLEEKIKTNNDLVTALNKIIALKEAYPELKADKSYLKLSNDLIKIEDEIAFSRKYFNATVKDYNNKVEMFPGIIVAKMFGFKTKNMFMASMEERKSVKVG